MAGQFNRYYEKGTTTSTGLTDTYYVITPYTTSYMWDMYRDSNPYYTPPSTTHAIKPALNLKENVYITGGDGTKENPFTIESGISIKYSSHISGKGWMDYESDDNISGTPKDGEPMEAIKITMNDAKGLTGDVEYRVHVQTDGWKSYVKNDEIAGTTGQNKGIEAIQIRLTGELKEQYDIYYNVYIIGSGWQGYKKNDEIAGTTGASKRIEAIKIKLEKKS